MILFDFFLILGFLYSAAGAFWAAWFFLRNRLRVEDRVVLWAATVFMYFMWLPIVADEEARRAAFHKEAQ